jgi:hypothetical protein
MFHGMIDMSLAPSEAKDEFPTAPMLEAKQSAPVYPYGLCISLEDEQLEKLGLEGDLPEVGELVHLMGMARVTCASEQERILPDGSKKKCSRVELQIVALKAEDEDREDPEERLERRETRDNTRRSSFYDEKEGEDGEV